LVIDDMVAIDITQRFQGKPPSRFVLVNPGGQCLLDDPTARALKPRSQRV